MFQGRHCDERRCNIIGVSRGGRGQLLNKEHDDAYFFAGCKHHFHFLNTCSLLYLLLDIVNAFCTVPHQYDRHKYINNNNNKKNMMMTEKKIPHGT